jgi:(S)-ureidoglycine aminohydrolase
MVNKEISALTRSVVTRNHAIISPDGYINSNVPGWTGCTVNVIINEQMGARLCQTLVTLTADGKLTGQTDKSQIFFYVVKGSCEASVGPNAKSLTEGQFVYVPVGESYTFEKPSEGTQILTFHKVYEPLAGHATPGIVWGDRKDVAYPDSYMGDTALHIQELLPNVPGFDMAVNIFTYDTGGHLPMVETHIMEHGLLYLQGQAIYMLDQQWYPVKKGDSIWMAPYCQQWATAMGQEPSVYIYYKNVNRFPTTV